MYLTFKVNNLSDLDTRHARDFPGSQSKSLSLDTIRFGKSLSFLQKQVFLLEIYKNTWIRAK